MLDLRKTLQHLSGIRRFLGRWPGQSRLRCGPCRFRLAGTATCVRDASEANRLTTSTNRYQANVKIIGTNVPLPLALHPRPLYSKAFAVATCAGLKDNDGACYGVAWFAFHYRATRERAGHTQLHT
ncbi:hypothetical protein EMIT0P258_20094 [Pseudomonas sp. IT-P258]